MPSKIKHIAFIMDGNGRWAVERNLKRIDGHSEGTKRIPEVIEACIARDIEYISFFAFSTENWKRPKQEINYIFKKVSQNLNRKNIKWFIDRRIALKVIGFDNKMSKLLLNKINHFSNSTNTNPLFHVNIFLNYGSRQEIVNACNAILSSNLKKIDEKIFTNYLLTKSIPDVDLLIRTSGEQRISNFMLFQIAYAEIIFEKTFWPAYTKNILTKNINQYNKRVRKFGGLQ